MQDPADLHARERLRCRSAESLVAGGVIRVAEVLGGIGARAQNADRD